MKKRIITLIALLLVSCMTLSGCSGDGIEESRTATNADAITSVEAQEPEFDPEFVEQYYLEVNGETVKMPIGKVYDYISADNVFRYTDLATDLGWHTRSPELQGEHRRNVYIFDKEDGDVLYLILSFDGDYIINIGFGYAHNKPWEEYKRVNALFDLKSLENMDGLYHIDDSWDTMGISLDQIMIIYHVFDYYREHDAEELFGGWLADYTGGGMYINY